MKTFKEWLEEKELAEGILKKAAALGLGMGGAVAGGALGLLGGPAALATAPAGWIIGKKLGVKAAEKLFPKDTAELMNKK